MTRTRERPTSAAGRGNARAPGVRLADALRREEDKLLACVHCGFCLPACPTYTRLGDEADSPRGRLYLMRAVVEGRIEPDASAFDTHIDRCLGCRACETVCPSGVEFGALLERARAVIADETGTHPATRLLLAVFGRRMLARPAMALGRALRATGLARRLMHWLPERFSRVRFGLAMLVASAAEAADAGRRSARRAASADPPGRDTDEPPEGDAATSDGAPASLTIAGPPSRHAHSVDAPTIGLLSGCVQDGLFGRVNRATARVLRTNGFRVAEIAGQRCCGALHAHAGHLDAARRLARRNIDAFGRAGVDLVVVNAAGCGAAMKEYGDLLADDPEYAAAARALADRVHDPFELLAAAGPRTGAPIPLRVTYDAPCHLHHAQRVTRAPLDVLDTVPALERVSLPAADECCGGAGIYGVLHADLGGRILRDKIVAIRSTGADAVVTPNPGCIMQIGAGLLLDGEDTPVVHPIELLDASYRLANLYGEDG